MSGTTPNNYLYRGEQHDSDLDLYYLRARYYNPLSGRFMSRDPEDGDLTNPASLHKYLYADGNPVNGIDPMGREDLIECALLGSNGLGACGAPRMLSISIPKPTNVCQALFSLAGAVAGFGLVEGTIGIGAAAAGPAGIVLAEAAQVTVGTALAAGAAGAGYLTGHAIGSKLCGNPKDRCPEIEARLQYFIGAVTRDYQNLLMDVQEQYIYAYAPPPPPGYAITWEGHLEAYRNDQAGLRKWLVQALVNGCKIPPGAFELADSPPPVSPAGRIPR